MQRNCVMIKTYVIEKSEKSTKEQLDEVNEAKKHPIVFDEDCEELSAAMTKAIRSAVVMRNRRDA